MLRVPLHTIPRKLKFRNSWLAVSKVFTSVGLHFCDAENNNKEILWRRGSSFILSSVNAERRYELEQLPNHHSLLSQRASALTIYREPIVIYDEEFRSL